jgi:KDO2-lipid IV(A) lauroyltransferase
MNKVNLTDYFGFGCFWLIVKLCKIVPFWLLYRLSDSLFFILYYILPFRRNVALDNLTRSFPNKSNDEIKHIYKQHVAYMCDVTLEMLKGFSLTTAQLSQRWQLTNPELMHAYRTRQVILIAGHYCNWEWGISLQAQIEHHCIYIYKPIRNTLINNFILHSRKKMRFTLLKVKDFAHYFANHTEPACYTLIADQHPGGSQRLHWMPFLQQDTAFITGPETYAKKTNLPVVYIAMDRIKRGYYKATLHNITPNAQASKPGEITEKSMRLLEQQIIANPQYWLWGHKRWKLKR